MSEIVLWIISGLLAVVFLMAGAMKAMQPKAKLAENMAWVEDFSDMQVKGIGILEILGAIGLILPMLTGIAPILTPLAAVGLVLTMVGAAITHIRQGDEIQQTIPSVVLGVLALVAAIGWFGVV
ncbi:MAG: DoxX family protein [Chloroflexota bacterium]